MTASSFGKFLFVFIKAEGMWKILVLKKFSKLLLDVIIARTISLHLTLKKLSLVNITLNLLDRLYFMKKRRAGSITFPSHDLLIDCEYPTPLVPF